MHFFVAESVYVYWNDAKYFWKEDLLLTRVLSSIISAWIKRFLYWAWRYKIHHHLDAVESLFLQGWNTCVAIKWNKTAITVNINVCCCAKGHVQIRSRWLCDGWNGALKPFYMFCWRTKTNNVRVYLGIHYIRKGKQLSWLKIMELVW